MSLSTPVGRWMHIWRGPSFDKNAPRIWSVRSASPIPGSSVARSSVMKSQRGLWCSWVAHNPQCTPNQHAQPFNLKYRPTDSEEETSAPFLSTRSRSNELSTTSNARSRNSPNPAPVPPLEIRIVKRFENLLVLVLAEAAQLLELPNSLWRRQWLQCMFKDIQHSRPTGDPDFKNLSREAAGRSGASSRSWQ